MIGADQGRSPVLNNSKLGQFGNLPKRGWDKVGACLGHDWSMAPLIVIRIIS